MLVFGDRAPPSPKWWAPWVYTIVFGVVAGFLTYGSLTYGPPANRGGRGGSAAGGWVVVGMLWLFVAVALVRSIVVTMRRLRGRS